ncbi:MAG: hypothetical protein ACI8RD_003144 [Bacillariaceae sp.]|jgi:hypothetical protein
MLFRKRRVKYKAKQSILSVSKYNINEAKPEPKPKSKYNYDDETKQIHY